MASKAFRFMRTPRVPSPLIIGTLSAAFGLTAFRMYDFMSLNKKLFPPVTSADQDPNYMLYHAPDLAKSREMAKELILNEMSKVVELQRSYNDILAQINDNASDSVKEAAASIADDAYTLQLQEWQALLKEDKLSQAERQFLRSWLNRSNTGVIPARLAFDDCAVEASKNPNAVRLNPMADPSRVDIAKVSELLANE